MTRSKGTQAVSRTWVRCRASAHGTRALPTELNGTHHSVLAVVRKFDKSTNHMVMAYIVYSFSFQYSRRGGWRREVPLDKTVMCCIIRVGDL